MPGTSSKNGIEAQLTYIPASSPVVKSGLTTDHFAPGATDVTVAPAQIFLGQVNAPTNLFSDGFRDSRGNALKDSNGDMLIEWFSLRGQTQIQLNPTDQEGDYQFALLSDDGSLMRVDRSGNENFETWINNDAVQGNTLGCAAKTVHLKPGVPMPVQIRYFQGPRYRIAFMLLWRKNPAKLGDLECGVRRGDDYFFKSKQPTNAFNDLLARGWSVVPASNFYLPGDKVNPCADEYGPNIPTEEDMLDKYGCGAKSEKKVLICKAPNGESPKPKEICVALQGAVNGHQVPLDGSVGPTGNHFGSCK